MNITKTEKHRAIKKIDIAIDKMIDLQSMGLGVCTYDIERILDKLNSARTEIEMAD